MARAERERDGEPIARAAEPVRGRLNPIARDQHFRAAGRTRTCGVPLRRLPNVQPVPPDDPTCPGVRVHVHLVTAVQPATLSLSPGQALASSADTNLEAPWL